MLGIAGAVSAITLTNQTQTVDAQESVAQDTDPWVGSYLKYARYDLGRLGQFAEAQTITISKNGDGYSLSKPYDEAQFKEITKGILSDRVGGLGKIFFGSVEYADGKKDSILRAEFCYEDFILYRKTVDVKARTSQPAGK